MFVHDLTVENKTRLVYYNAMAAATKFITAVSVTL